MCIRSPERGLSLHQVGTQVRTLPFPIGTGRTVWLRNLVPWTTLCSVGSRTGHPRLSSQSSLFDGKWGDSSQVGVPCTSMRCHSPGLVYPMESVTAGATSTLTLPEMARVACRSLRAPSTARTAASAMSGALREQVPRKMAPGKRK